MIHDQIEDVSKNTCNRQVLTKFEKAKEMLPVISCVDSRSLPQREKA